MALADTPSTRTRSWVLVFIAVALVAMNLRMTITGVGPVLDQIAEDQGVSPAALGLLASVPMIAWAIVSPIAHTLAERFGLNTTVSWSLVLLMIATLWRSLPGASFNLWAGTALLGAAIAIGNVLIPAVIKRDFGRRVPVMMGMYSALLGIAAAIGAAMVVPISLIESPSGNPLGWRWALFATGLLAPVALLIWWLAARKTTSQATSQPDPTSSKPVQKPGKLGALVWRDATAWFIAVYMGTLSWNFYVFGTWYAPIDISRGVDPVLAGIHVSEFHTFAVVGSVIAPFAARGVMHKVVPLLSPLLMAVGAAGFILAPDLMLLWLMLSGFGCGSGLYAALTFIAERSATVSVSSAVSGMVQSFGYLVTAVGPVLFGLVYGWSGEWISPLGVVLFAAFAQLIAGLALWRKRMALAHLSHA